MNDDEMVGIPVFGSASSLAVVDVGRRERNWKMWRRI
jgi:hypothetical protein